MLTIDCSVLTQGSAALFGQAVSLVVANVVQLVMTNVVEGDRPEQNLSFSDLVQFRLRRTQKRLALT